MSLYMVIERFEGDDMAPVYQRLNAAGRGLPSGLRFKGSWVEASFARVFQLMECDDPGLFQSWILHWRGTGARFEIVPVVPGDQTARLFEMEAAK